MKQVYFCESALDAMAFYQENRMQLHTDMALVSLGGTFSDRQVTGVMSRFPHARAFDCFDNDLAGRIYGLRMIALLENIPMKISKTDKGLQVEVKDKVFTVNPHRPLSAQLEKHLSIRYQVGQWLPPKLFKDWNDCLLKKPMDIPSVPRKNERKQQLSERRKGNLKM